MKRVLRIWLLVCGLASASAEVVPIEKIFGDKLRAEVVQKATACDAQRIRFEYLDPRDFEKGFKITPVGESHALSQEALRLLKEALLRRYEDSEASKFCMPLPGIRYQLSYKGRSTSIFVCYRCRIIIVGESGRIVGGRGADEIIAELRAVAISFLKPDEVAKLP